MSLAQTVSAAPSVQSRTLSSASADAVSIPWTMWLIVVGISITALGSYVDLAWHKAIGAEAFWTPGHIMIGLGAALLGGIACWAEILATAWGGDSGRRAASLRVLGVHAPAGVLLAVWGSTAMIASGPFDDWWHRAYGLDLRLLTPPHSLLRLGLYAVIIGALIWIASMINRSTPALHGRLAWLFLIVGAILMMHLPLFGQTTRTNMHSATCYLAFALVVPTFLIATRRGSAHKWGCTIIAAIYTGFSLAFVWLLPLFPAQPKVGPVYHQVTHLIPQSFPLLLIVPTLIVDLLLQKLEGRSSWIKAVWVGPAFVLGFLAVQWPFADFLMSPASRNWIFGAGYFAYNDPAGVLFDPYVFKVAEKTTGAFVLTMAAAVVASIATTRLGLAWGDWMRRVRR